MFLAIQLGGQAAAIAAASPYTPLQPQSEPSVGGQDWSPPKAVLEADPAADKAMRSAKPVTWPSAGRATVDLRAAKAADTSGVHPVSAGDLPIILDRGSSRTGKGATPAGVTVEILDHTMTAGHGFPVVLRLAQTEASTAAGTVNVTVDYAKFKDAYGADWSSRLRFSAVTDCALTVRTAVSCNARPIASHNDPQAHTLSADVELPAATAASKRSAGETSDGGLLTLAVTSDTSSNAGDFSASAPTPSSTWSAGKSSGDFAWEYPLRMPPSLGGPTPAVGLSYSSQSVDGRTAASNNQPTWIGEGFSFWPGSISRGYKACSDDLGGNATNTTKTGDMCWGTYNASLSMAGHSGELIRDDSTGKYRMKNDDGTRVELLTGASNGDNNGEYWRVTTPDGTQYFFGLNHLPGWTAGKAETASTWTVPVFGNNPGVNGQPDEPCYSSTFANAYCDQAWQWNIDYVLDVHGNSMSFWYGKESNNYARNNTDSKVSQYVRGGFLDRIDYGTDNRTTVNSVATDTVYTSTKPPMSVDFTQDNRCIPGSTCDSAHPASWPDVPWDLKCTSTTSCPGLYAASFWTQYRLASVKTQVWGGSAYRDVEMWTLTHSFPDPGDGTRPGLWLEKIGHVGLVPSSTSVEGSAVTLPDVTFAGTQKQNRVDADHDGLLKMNWWRVAYIYTETGAKIGVQYSAPECVAGSSMPTSPDNNYKKCFPVYWTRPGYTSPTIDWFHKYVVTAVTESDMTSGAQRTITGFAYSNSTTVPLWHYDADDGLVPASRKTWGQWRGYDQVDTTKGDSGEQTFTRTRYFRGMNGDKTPSGGRTVTVDGISDDDAFAGMPRESITYNGPNGAEVSGSLTTPWKSASATATRTINGVKVEAHYTGTASVVSRRTRDGGRDPITTTTTNTYDETYGYITSVNDSGDDSVTGDETCSITSRVTNSTAWIIGLPSMTEQYALPCGTSPTREDDVISIERTSYDGLASGAVPTKGDLTQQEKAKKWTDATHISWVVTSKASFDPVTGRLSDNWDVRGNRTTTTYTPAAGGPITKIVTTGPLGSTETNYEPAWSLSTSVIDVNGRRTEVTYDALGRLKRVWYPIRSRSAGASASVVYSYNLNKTLPSVLTTQKLNSAGNYVTKYEIFDSLLRPRQEQAPASNGSGRILSDTYYDTAGRVAITNATYFNAAAPSGTIYSPTFNEIPAQNVSVYDGAGRTIKLTLFSKGLEQWHTTTSYGGDRIDITPPEGGTATSTYSNGRDERVKLIQYQNGTPSGPGDTTLYAYDRRGNLREVTDARGNKWTYTYDLLGRTTRATDPDKGIVTSDYNDAGDLLTSTDARPQSLAFSYDGVGRKTGVFDTSLQGTQLAKWTYDTAVFASDGVTKVKGYLASSTRYVGGNAYTFTARGYSDDYQSTGTTIAIPSVPGEEKIAGSYVYTQSFNVDGSPNSTRFPGAGGLTAELVTYGYDTATGLPKTLTTNYADATNYVTNTQYTAFGEPSVVTLATAISGAKVAQIGLYYDEARRLPVEIVTARETGPSTVSDSHYSYDPAGNVTKIEETAAASAETQCFESDYLQRLTHAWTPSNGDCEAERSASTLGGPSKYWLSWTYDNIGNRRSETNHTDTGDQTSTYAYPNAGQAQPHGVTGISGAAAGTYDYDAVGNTRHRPGPAGTQTLSWDPEGHLASLQDTFKSTFIYDADGGRLVSHDAAGVTLYLPGMEVRATTSTGAVSAVRYYTHTGRAVAMRTPSGVTWLSADLHGTAGIAVDATTQSMTQRRFTPFGGIRSGPSAWINPHGFVNGTDDPSGLVHLGAREYDKQLGRFISVDPVLEIENPQQVNGYAYANNSPYTFTDPGGTDFWGWVSEKAQSVNDFMDRNVEQITQLGEALLMIEAGIVLITIGVGGDAVGLAVTCTGAGAIVGVPAMAISTTAVVAGSALVLGGAAVAGNAVSKMDFEGGGGGPSESSGPKFGDSEAEKAANAGKLRDEHNSGIKSDNPKDLLSDVNARAAVEPPAGTKAIVDGSGGVNADVKFADSTGNEIPFRREVKVTNGNFRSFESQLSKGLDQVGAEGEIWIQTEHDISTMRSYLQKYMEKRIGKRSFSPHVTIRVYNHAGQSKGSYNLATGAGLAAAAAGGCQAMWGCHDEWLW
ncbi:RHS repeat domain-containing protein [Hamadaea flava]|uniref:RHS repeat domain-containing protein n=1 Tax=Hamadaea flava TaxID=1742688 RepID=A0ABV8LZP9_9ACTN